MNEQQVEQEIKCKGLNAPRITPEHIDALMAASDIKFHHFPGTTTTVCLVILPNGFTVTGTSACASPENFDADLGKKIAANEARGKLWQLEGYLLRDRLHTHTMTAVKAR